MNRVWPENPSAFHESALPCQFLFSVLQFSLRAVPFLRLSSYNARPASIRSLDLRYFEYLLLVGVHELNVAGAAI